MYKKLICMLIINFLLLALFNPIFAQDKKSYTYEIESKILWKILPNNGTPEYIPPDFSISINRQTGILAILKLFNLTQNSQTMSNSEVESVLSKYTDNKQISTWARKPLAYAIKNHITSGTQPNKISPNDSFDGKMFSAICLNIMGYKLNSKEYPIAAAILSEKGGLSLRQAVYFNNRNLIMDDLIGMLFGTLKSSYSDGKSVIQKLIDEGSVNLDTAKKYELIK
jgi:hypothetical protein